MVFKVQPKPSCDSGTNHWDLHFTSWSLVLPVQASYYLVILAAWDQPQPPSPSPAVLLQHLLKQDQNESFSGGRGYFQPDNSLVPLCKSLRQCEGGGKLGARGWWDCCFQSDEIWCQFVLTLGLWCNAHASHG